MAEDRMAASSSTHPNGAIQVDLSGRRAMVTGGAAGIGLAIATALSRSGARVLLADLDEERGQEMARTLDQGVFCQADLSDPHQCRELVRAAETTLGGIDILVNNAGIQHVAPIEDFPEERWEYLLR